MLLNDRIHGQIFQILAALDCGERRFRLVSCQNKLVEPPQEYVDPRTAAAPFALEAPVLSGGQYVIEPIWERFLPNAAHADPAESRLEVTVKNGELIGFSVGQLFWGPIGDRYGRRKPIAAGMVLFVIGSMVADPDLTTIRNAQAQIVATRAAAGDTKLANFDLGVQNMGSNGEIPTGCDWHPNVADHQRMAGILKAQIQAKLGW